MKRFKIFFIVAAFIFVTGGFMQRVLAADTYPYPNASMADIDPWNFYYRYCTSYAAWKAEESGVPFLNGMTGPNGNAGLFGHAHNWNDNANYIGFTANGIPSPGTVAVWEENKGGALRWGHVAWVDSINSDGSINISEYNYNTAGAYATRRIFSSDLYYWPSSFVHFNSQCGGQSITIENKTVSNGSTFNCTANQDIVIKPETTFESGSDVRLYINEN